MYEAIKNKVLRQFKDETLVQGYLDKGWKVTKDGIQITKLEKKDEN